MFVNERVDLRDGDDLGHEAAEPLWLQEIQFPQVALYVRVMEEHSRLMKKPNSLQEED